MVNRTASPARLGGRDKHMRLTRRQAMLGGLGLTALAAGPLLPRSRALADEVTAVGDSNMRFFRIGTGSTAGTYYPVGGILAAAISNPPGSHPCDEGGSCGVPGLIAVAQSTDGSVDNVRRMEEGSLESGLCQADIAYWAETGEQIFADQGPIDDLRVIASLYAETLHLVVRRGAGIRKVSDLAGKRVSLDRVGSGTRVDAVLLLEAYGLSPEKLDEQPLSPGQAVEALRNDALDAFFLVAGAPVAAIAELAETQRIDLLPLLGPEVEGLAERYPFLYPDPIVSGTYRNMPATPSLSVAALWLISASVDASLVEAITAALWHPATAAMLAAGHPRAREIRLETALKGVTIPALHEGALAYYRSVGVVTD